MHGLKSTLEGAIGEKMDSEEKDQVKEAMEDGQSWLDSNPDADADDIKEKQKEIEEICAPIISKHYGGQGAQGAAEEEDDDDHDEL